MQYQVSDSIRLIGTKHDWQLQRKRTITRKGEPPTEEWQAFKYYTTFASAIRAMAEYDVRIAQDTDDLTVRLDRVQGIAENAATQLSDALHK